MVNSDPPIPCWTLELAPQSLQEKAIAFRSRSIGEHKRELLQAVQERDVEYLWMVTEMHLVINGLRGSRISSGTLRGYKSGVMKYLKYCHARDINILRLGPDDPAMYRAYLVREGVTVQAGREKGLVRGCPPSGTSLNITTVRTLYRALKWLGVIDSDPFVSVKVARKNLGDRRCPYPLADVDKLLAGASPLEEMMVLLGAHAGLRVDEALQIKWADVDRHTSTLTVRHGKGDKMRRVPLTTTLMQALETYEAGILQREYILPYRSDVWLRNHMIALCKRVQVPYLGYHSLRHTLGTRLYRETRDLQDVARFLGHDDTETARIYIHFEAEWSEEDFIL